MLEFEERNESICVVVRMDGDELKESEGLLSTAVFDPRKSKAHGEITKRPERERSRNAV
jgi:hypothetical protein